LNLKRQPGTYALKNAGKKHVNKGTFNFQEENKMTEHKTRKEVLIDNLKRRIAIDEEAAVQLFVSSYTGRDCLFDGNAGLLLEWLEGR